jgi:hypothetical protein
MGTAAAILAIFALSAGLMLARRLPALLAVPAMAVAIAAVVRTPGRVVLEHVIAAGAARLADAYVMVLAGAMLGRIVMQTGIAEGIVKRAAEFGGDRPLAVATALLAAVALLFTTLFGLGAIIMVGSLALPIMLSLGIPRRLAGVLFLLGFGLGFVFNIGTWGFYQKSLELDPRAIKGFAVLLAAFDAGALALFLLLAARRMTSHAAWAVAAEALPSGEEERARPPAPLLALLVPVLPLVLHALLGWPVVAAFLVASLAAVLLTRPREAVQQLAGAAVSGVEDVAPAVLLMIGIGMLLNATTLPAVQTALRPAVTALPLASRPVFVLAFGLLSPLALYRGPLNPYGIGIGIYALVRTLGLLPPAALLAAVMSVVQVQNVCDPTNTANVWVANYVGIRVEEITRDTLLFKFGVCLAGLAAGALLYL